MESGSARLAVDRRRLYGPDPGYGNQCRSSITARRYLPGRNRFEQKCDFATLLVAITNVLATVIALVLVDRAGPEASSLCRSGRHDGRAVCAFFLLSQAGATGAVAGQNRHRLSDVFITCYAFSIGPIAWIIVSEVFPLRVRGRGVAAATLSFGTSNFLVSLTFLSSPQGRWDFAYLRHVWGILHPHIDLRALCDSRDKRA